MGLAAAYGIDVRPPIGPLAASGGAVSVEAGAHLVLDNSTTGGKDYHSFPGAVYAGGKVHVVYHSGTDHVATGDGEIRYLQLSTAGAILAGPTIIAPNPGGGVNLTNPTIGVTATGRLIVTYSKDPPRRPYRIYSDDGGTSWSAEAALPMQWTSFTDGPGPVFTPTGGPILKPIYGKNVGDNNYSCGVVRSTDDGATWGDFTSIASTGFLLDWEEPDLFERPDGLLGVMIRTDNASVIYASFNSRGGVAPWSKPVAAFGGVGHPSAKVLDSGCVVVVTRDANAPGRPVFTYSLDGAQSWAVLANLETTGLPFEYAGLAKIAANRLLCVYSVSLDPDNPYNAATLKSCYLSQL